MLKDRIRVKLILDIKSLIKELKMIYGFLYVGMIFSIASLWLFLAVLPKPDFIEEPIEKFKNLLREFLGSKNE